MSCGGCGKNRIAHGAVGLARAALGIGRAAKSLKDQRLKVCMTCEHGGGGEGWTRKWFCRQCRCLRLAKAGDRREQCPAGRWPESDLE